MNIAHVGNTAAIAAVGSKGLRFYWQKIGGGSWHSELVADPNPPITGAWLAQVGNTAAIAAVRTDGSLWFHWQTIGDAGPWNEEQVAGPPNTASSTSVAQIGNSAGITAVGGNGLKFYWQKIGGGPWHPEQLVLSATNSLAQVGNTAAVADVRQDGSLWYHFQAIDTVPWFPQLVSSPSQKSLPVTAASIAQVGNSAGSLPSATV
jgi:hypothetical protein